MILRLMYVKINSYGDIVVGFFMEINDKKLPNSDYQKVDLLIKSSCMQQKHEYENCHSRDV